MPFVPAIWCFLRVPASDFKNGIAVGKRPGFPNYGSDAEMQAEYVFTRMNRVLEQAGTSLEETLEIAALRARSAHVPRRGQDMESLHAGAAVPQLDGVRD